MKDKKIIKQHVSNILKKGYTKIENILNATECDKIKNISKKLYINLKKKTKIRNPLEQTIYNLHNKNDIFIKFIDHKAIIGIVKQALSAGSYNNNDDIILRQSAVRNPKKGFAQQLHNDSRISGSKNPLIIQVIWLLDEFNKDNGATRVVPGSHLKNSFPKQNKKYSNEKQLNGKKGSVILFNAAMWHGSSKKTSSKERWGMIFSYSRWFLKPSFDTTQNTKLKIYNKLNRYQKELLGFKFNPPKDEFTRSSAKSKKLEKPKY